MKCYFFDYTSKDRTLRDFQGCLFRSVHDAREHAQLLAVHLQCDPAHDYSGWTVIMCDALGVKVHSVQLPVTGASRAVVFRADNGARLRPLAAA